jgi:20S proteasome alpha/beta subunit
MILVLGGHCRDGVVIVTDMKITSLASGTPVFLKYDTKISGVFMNIIFGYAGDVDTYDVYLNYAIGDAVRKRDDPNDAFTNDNFIQRLCENMTKIRKILARNQRDLLLRIMVGRQFPGKGKSDLHKVNSNGDQNLVTTYAILGDADIFADKLIKGKWQSDMRMREFAELSYCVIRYIEEKSISEAVGLGKEKPPTKYLKDAENIDTDLTDEDWEQFKDSYRDYENYFDSVRPSF